MKKTVYSNHRVEVFPVIDRYMWPASVSDEDAERKNIARSLETLVEALKRHNDFESLAVRYDTDEVCAHCGRPWTEESTTYNGGCCDKDVEAEDARIAAQTVTG